MSIEDDLFNAFKYTGFTQKTDPTKMIRSILRNLEVSMLSQMRARIQTRLSELQQEQGSVDVSPNDSMDPFTILGVDVNSTREEVDKAYREKAKTTHPDVGGSTIEMVRVNAAYESIRLFKGWKTK